jgi:hypothetical protein
MEIREKSDHPELHLYAFDLPYSGRAGLVLAEIEMVSLNELACFKPRRKADETMAI